MTKYLITGCAGHIGSRVVARLLQLGSEVIGVDNLNDAYDVRLKQWRLQQMLKEDHFTFHEMDICDQFALSREVFGLHRLDGVIHLAARTGIRRSVDLPFLYYETNVRGTLTLLELCRHHGVKKFVQASSSSVYGERKDGNFREDEDSGHPLSPYSATKKSCEILCYTYHRLYSIDTTVLRYFSVFGPAGRPDMSLFRFVQWVSEERPVIIFGDGTQRRDFTYVEDAADATVRSLRPLGYEIINIGTTSHISILEALHEVETLMQKKAKLEFRSSMVGEVSLTHADNSRARELLDWGPQVSFHDGMAATVDWYQKNRKWARIIATL